MSMKFKHMKYKLVKILLRIAQTRNSISLITQYKFLQKKKVKQPDLAVFKVFMYTSNSPEVTCRGLILSTFITHCPLLQNSQKGIQNPKTTFIINILKHFMADRCIRGWFSFKNMQSVLVTVKISLPYCSYTTYQLMLWVI